MLTLSDKEKSFLKRLDTPRKIQDFLDALPVNFELRGDTCMSPRRVLREGRAHCMEGALLAAAALWINGKRPLLLDLKAAKEDDSHVVALFRVHGRWGAISKTNHAVLRYREPVYGTIRELALSYFHEYFLNNGKKTLRSYAGPFDLRRFRRGAWVAAEDDLWDIVEAIDAAPHLMIAPLALLRTFRLADPIERAAGKITEWRSGGRPGGEKRNRFQGF